MSELLPQLHELVFQLLLRTFADGPAGFSLGWSGIGVTDSFLSFWFCSRRVRRALSMASRSAEISAISCSKRIWSSSLEINGRRKE